MFDREKYLHEIPKRIQEPHAAAFFLFYLTHIFYIFYSQTTIVYSQTSVVYIQTSIDVNVATHLRETLTEEVHRLLSEAMRNTSDSATDKLLFTLPPYTGYI